MASINISVKLDKRRLDMLSGGLKAKEQAVLDKAAFDVEALWKENIVAKGVVDTGAYLNSVHAGPGENEHQRIISDGVEYGVYQEFGTVAVPARPCATPAVAEVEKGFAKAFEELLR